MPTISQPVNRALNQIKWHSEGLSTFTEGRDKSTAHNEQLKREIDDDVKIRLSCATATAQQKKHELQLIVRDFPHLPLLSVPDTTTAP